MKKKLLLAVMLAMPTLVLMADNTEVPVKFRNGNGAGNFGIISPAPEIKPEFTADRPFVFIISENACKVPLFMGVVNTLGQR